MSLEDGLDRRIDARLKCHTALPLIVHQRNVEQTVGLPGADYLVAARRGAFPSTKERRLVIARTADVIAWLDRRLVVHRDVKPANDASAETITLARVGARRVSA